MVLLHQVLLAYHPFRLVPVVLGVLVGIGSGLGNLRNKFFGGENELFTHCNELGDRDVSDGLEC